MWVCLSVYQRKPHILLSYLKDIHDSPCSQPPLSQHLCLFIEFCACYSFSTQWSKSVYLLYLAVRISAITFSPLFFYSNHHLSSVFVNNCFQFCNMHNPLYCRYFRSLLCSCINKIYAVAWFTTKSSINTCSSSNYNIWAALNTNFSYQPVMQMTDVTMLQTKNNYFRSFL